MLLLCVSVFLQLSLHLLFQEFGSLCYQGVDIFQICWGPPTFLSVPHRDPDPVKERPQARTPGWGSGKIILRPLYGLLMIVTSREAWHLKKTIVACQIPIQVNSGV
jgi:hypothetical protein